MGEIYKQKCMLVQGNNETAELLNVSSMIFEFLVKYSRINLDACCPSCMCDIKWFVSQGICSEYHPCLAIEASEENTLIDDFGLLE